MPPRRKATSAVTIWPVFGLGRAIVRSWPNDPDSLATLTSPRDDFILEASATSADDATWSFTQEHGPFRSYERTVAVSGDRLTETTEYRLAIPWFGWLFAWPVQRALARRGHHATPPARPRNPWWAPPDRLDQRQAMVLGLLAAAAMASAFTNTLFTQTATFAADSFGVGDRGVSWAGAVVRFGVVVALPFAVVADRLGRRRVIRVVAWAAPLICAMGALAPSFPVLVATQTIGRPLGLALDLLIAVVAAEEMPRSSRAYAVSVMAMASGLGAGIAVMALPLADLGEHGWRLVYVLTLIWLVAAIDISRRLPETIRFEVPHTPSPPMNYRRFAVLAGVAICANFFVAPASFFQNRYLNDVRGLSASMVSIFTLTTATPAALGLVVGGRIADVRGRRRLIAISIPIATSLIVLSFLVRGAPMWLSAFGGGFVGGIAYPALAVYRAELFPTGNRGKASGFLTTAALLGGSVGILVVGHLLDSGRSYGHVMGVVALAQLAVVVLVLSQLPETAHRELEDLNPEDPAPVE